MAYRPSPVSSSSSPSIFGILIGCLLFYGSFLLLWWNEKQLAHLNIVPRMLSQIVVTAPGDQIDPALNGKLVALTALLTSTAYIGDSQYLKPVSYALIERRVEMYQWMEKKETSNGAVSYSYSQGWKRGREESALFRNPGGHENPNLTVRDARFIAPETKLGPLNPTSILNQIELSSRVSLNADSLYSINLKVKDDYILVKRNPNSDKDEFGDIRISYYGLKPGPISVLGMQNSGGIISPYIMETDNQVFVARPGVLSAHDLISTLRIDAGTKTISLRLIGFILMWIGLLIALFLLPNTLSLLSGLAGKSQFFIVGVSGIMSLILSFISIYSAMTAQSLLILFFVLAISALFFAFAITREFQMQDR